MSFLGPGSGVPPRVVLFLTQPCGPDVPAAEPRPACLLPFGPASFAESVLDSCARAGLREIDLVISDQPEQLRTLLGDGWRWGLQLHWHLAISSEHPYSLLTSLASASHDRVLLGHGHCWLDSEALHELLRPGPRIAIATQPTEEWLGWAQLEWSQFDALAHDIDVSNLGQLLLCLDAQRITPGPGRWARAGSAQELLAAQTLALHQLEAGRVPATWQLHAWGAAHPQAQIHPAAQISGPVLIGPRCLVERGAVLGPNTVLAADVLVATRAVVRDALILPDTYVSGSITLANVVAQGNRVQHLSWGVGTTLAPGDGLLTELANRRAPARRWGSRLLAATLLLLGAPLLPALQIWQLLHGRQASWYAQDSVLGRDPANGALRLMPLRHAHHRAGLSGWLLGRYGALIDVAQGRRQWFGVRPRNPAQWRALRRDWQLLFENQRVGFFHAPTWHEPGHADDLEAQAAADAFMAVQTGWRERWKMLDALLRNFSLSTRRD